MSQVEENLHFKPKLKVIRHEGTRHAHPVVKAEEDDVNDKLMAPKRGPVEELAHPNADIDLASSSDSDEELC